ncbi:hypothetical protein FH972_025124 [Carpinus fangiana]|uniref:Uncharacterized protein n=1 Tax=Carpinus fangiana TaxID=176857 RepID=A0A5N6L0C2_9ROSI|nr:hypothetical protein FH972_025124 [Carpinus fangiana]
MNLSLDDSPSQRFAAVPSAQPTLQTVAVTSSAPRQSLRHASNFVALVVCLRVVFLTWRVSALPQPADAPTSLKAAISSDFADPSIIHDGKKWYAFSTSVHNGPNVQVATSSDFKDWQIMPKHDALPELPAWSGKRQAHRVWAPDVIKNDNNEYVMYFSAVHASSPHRCVGVAKASQPEGPYATTQDPLICPLDAGGAIDASGFQDKNGTRYITYKEDRNALPATRGRPNSARHSTCGWSPTGSTPIMLQRVDATGTQLTGPASKILDRDPIDGPLVEASSLTRTKDGNYVLFFSSNCYNGPWYDLSYAIADRVEGPYEKSGPLLWPGSLGLHSPGGADVAPEGDRIVLHAGQVGRRHMYAVDIAIDGCGEVRIFEDLTHETPRRKPAGCRRCRQPAEREPATDGVGAREQMKPLARQTGVLAVCELRSIRAPFLPRRVEVEEWANCRSAHAGGRSAAGRRIRACSHTAPAWRSQRTHLVLHGPRFSSLIPSGACSGCSTEHFGGAAAPGV